ncbi:MAG: dihydrodipicolinate synthase family protein [Gemmatimonadaceae bacterium]
MSEPESSLDASARALVGRLEGTLIPAVPIPRRQNGKVHAEAQHSYAAWMTGQQIGGVAVWAHTGRGLHLDDDTRNAVLASWRSALPRPAAIVAGCGVSVDGSPLPTDERARTDAVIQRTLDMAEQARRGGADALLVHPPTALADLSDASARVVALHAELAAAGLPLLAFVLYRRASGLEYDDATLDRLLDLPHVAGVKLATLDSVMRFQDISARMTSNHADRLLITGEDRFLGYSLMLGARAALIGMGAARSAMQARLITSAAAGDWRTFARLTRACDAFASVTFVEPMEGYVQRMLWALAADGVIPDDACHDPHGPALSPDERSRLLTAMRTLDEVS